MDILDEIPFGLDPNDLINRLNSHSSVFFNEFMRTVDVMDDGIICFFEGYDAPYYIPKIEAVSRILVYPINCGGKSKVLEVFEELKDRPEYVGIKKGFFIDRDFDESYGVGDNRIYETPCYSIENFYTHVDCLKKMLRAKMNLRDDDPLFLKCITLFENLQGEFHEAILEFNAWYAYLVGEKNKGKIEDTGATLGVSPPPGFIKISLDSVEKNYDLEKIYLTKKLKGAFRCCEGDYALVLEEFRSCDKQSRFRGKYELYFLCRFLELVRSEYDKDRKKDIIAEAVKMASERAKGKPRSKNVLKPFNINVTQSEAIEKLCAYALYPDCLRGYIEGIV